MVCSSVFEPLDSVQAIVWRVEDRAVAEGGVARTPSTRSPAVASSRSSETVSVRRRLAEALGRQAAGAARTSRPL